MTLKMTIRIEGEPRPSPTQYDPDRTQRDTLASIDLEGREADVYGLLLDCIRRLTPVVEYLNGERIA